MAPYSTAGLLHCASRARLSNCGAEATTSLRGASRFILAVENLLWGFPRSPHGASATPPAGVDYGLQKGRGSAYETLQTQRSDGRDLRFEFVVEPRPAGGGSGFRGLFIQGPRGERFVYINIGSLRGSVGDAGEPASEDPVEPHHHGDGRESIGCGRRVARGARQRHRRRWHAGERVGQGTSAAGECRRTVISRASGVAGGDLPLDNMCF